MAEKRPKVLIVDDDRPILLMYADTLQHDGFDVVTEESGEGALARIIQDQNIDLIVTDIMMAKMDGWALLDFIRDDLDLNDMCLPVIVVSGVDSEDLELGAFRHRANAWFTKPIKPLSRLSEMARKLTGLKNDSHSSRHNQ